MSGYRAEELKRAASSSVGVSFGAKSFALQVRVIVETIEFIAGQIAELESALDAMLAETQGAWLKTVPGIDTALAAVIAGEVGDAKRFVTPRQLVAYARHGRHQAAIWGKRPELPYVQARLAVSALRPDDGSGEGAQA